MQCITKKNTLAKQLSQMKKQFPEEYKYFPKSWILPY